MNTPQNLTSTFIHLTQDLGAQEEETGPGFWRDLMEGKRPHLDEGRLVMILSGQADWPTWEMHPAGDELVTLISGSARLLLETSEGIKAIDLKTPGDFIRIPKGTWHTAQISEPTAMQFITPGEGTQHKPV